MKRIVTVMLVLILLIYTAQATGVYDYSRRFIDTMDQKGYKYTYVGLDSDNDDKIRTSFNVDGISGGVTFNLFFSSNGDLSVYAWNVVDFTCGLNYAYKTVSELNEKYKFAKFYVDTSDNSITVSANYILMGSDQDGDICLNLISRLVDILESSATALNKLI